MYLVGKGMRRTRASPRLSGGESPPKMAAAFAPDACTKIRSSAPSWPVCSLSVARISAVSICCAQEVHGAS